MNYFHRSFHALTACGVLFLLFVTACGTDSNGSSPLQGTWQSSFQKDTLTVDFNLQLDSSNGNITGTGTIDGMVQAQDGNATFTEEFSIQSSAGGTFDDPVVALTIQLGGDEFRFDGTLSSDAQLTGTAYLNVEANIVNDVQFPLVLEK